MPENITMTQLVRDVEPPRERADAPTPGIHARIALQYEEAGGGALLPMCRLVVTPMTLAR